MSSQEEPGYFNVELKIYEDDNCTNEIKSEGVIHVPNYIYAKVELVNVDISNTKFHVQVCETAYFYCLCIVERISAPIALDRTKLTIAIQSGESPIFSYKKFQRKKKVKQLHSAKKNSWEKDTSS